MDRGKGLPAAGGGWAGEAGRAGVGRRLRPGKSRLTEDDDVPAGLAGPAVEAGKLGRGEQHPPRRPAGERGAEVNGGWGAGGGPVAIPIVLTFRASQAITVWIT